MTLVNDPIVSRRFSGASRTGRASLRLAARFTSGKRGAPRSLGFSCLVAALGAIALNGACDGSGRTASAPPGAVPRASAPASGATSASVPAAPAASNLDAATAPSAEPAVPPPPSPYPAAAIDRARADNSANACTELVYKRGCSEVRTGHVHVRLTLGPQGNVEQVEILKNEIRRDPEVVAGCLKKKLPKWKFDPPDGATPIVELDLVFADKC